MDLNFSLMGKSERMQALNDNCEEVKLGFTYYKPLTSFEIEKLNSALNQALAEIERLKEERKELSSVISENQKLVLLNNKEIVRGFTEVCEKIWGVSNSETGFIEMINSDGDIIEKRRFKAGHSVSIFNNRENTTEKISKAI